MLKYEEQGTGCAVVLLHGFPLCRQMWRPQVGTLAAAGCRVICPDLPGFGESPLAERPVSIATYADAVIHLLDRLGIEKAVVGGMSMGGYVLLNLVERYAERLNAAMFLMTRASADDAAGQEKRTALANEVEMGNGLIVAETFSQVLFAPDTPESHPELVTEVRQWMESTPPAGIVDGLLAMRDRNDYVAKLAGFKLPCLVVGGEQDQAVSVEHCRVLQQGLADADLITIPGAGHMANLEQPQLFNQAVIGFLRQFSD